jgi:hypothetical protein
VSVSARFSFERSHFESICQKSAIAKLRKGYLKGLIPNPLWRTPFSFLVVETFHRNVSIRLRGLLKKGVSNPDLV